MTSEMVEDDIDIWSHYLRHEQNGNLKKAVKLSVYTVPEVWNKARKIIAQFDGGTLLESKGIWLDKEQNEVHDDADACIIIVFAESIKKVEQIRWIIKMIAEHCSEIAVLESIEPVLISESSTKGSIAKFNQSNPVHRKIVSAVKAGIINQYSSEILQEFSHLGKHAKGDAKALLDFWKDIDYISEQQINQIHDSSGDAL